MNATMPQCVKAVRESCPLSGYGKANTDLTGKAMGSEISRSAYRGRSRGSSSEVGEMMSEEGHRRMADVEWRLPGNESGQVGV